MTGWLRRTALALAALSFVGMAVPTGDPGQFASLLFLIWILAASISLGRRERRAAETATAIPARA